MTKAASAPSPAVRMVNIQPDQEGQRIDNFLRTLLKGVPKSHIYRVLRKGEVRVNKGRVGPDYRLQVGDCVRVPPVRTAEAGEEVRPARQALETLASRILYEDKELIIINKPAGMAVHGGSGVSYGVIEALRQMHPHASFLELVHRLDRDTSGCLMIAKKRSVLKELHEKLRGDGINKVYLALIKGPWRGGPRRVAAALKKNILKSGERMVSVDEAGKAAVTHFKPVTVFREASLMEVTLETGRTHQIRVHAQHLGRPIAGDPKYGDVEFNALMRSRGLRRMFLHAWHLDFELEQGGRIDVTAPLDDDLQAFLDKLPQ